MVLTHRPTWPPPAPATLSPADVSSPPDPVLLDLLRGVWAYQLDRLAFGPHVQAVADWVSAHAADDRPGLTSADALSLIHAFRHGGGRFRGPRAWCPQRAFYRQLRAGCDAPAAAAYALPAVLWELGRFTLTKRPSSINTTAAPRFARFLGLTPFSAAAFGVVGGFAYVQGGTPGPADTMQRACSEFGQLYRFPVTAHPHPAGGHAPRAWLWPVGSCDLSPWDRTESRPCPDRLTPADTPTSLAV